MNSITNLMLVLSLISFFFGTLFSLGYLLGHPSILNKIIPIILLPCGFILFIIWYYFVVILGLFGMF